MRFWKFLLPLVASSLCFATQSDRISGPIDSSQRIALPGGHTHHKALPQYDQGRIEPSFQFGYVTMLFTPSAAQSQALDLLLAQQQDRSSPNFHKWLTPEQFADRFGLTSNDMQKVTDWLKLQGLQIVSVARGRQFVVFGGTAAQIESAFQTEIHRYNVDGEAHFANATMPSIPASLSGIVGGFRGLNDFHLKPSVKRHPDFTASGFSTHFLAPGDLYTIYDITALQSAGFTGAGQKIAILGQTDLITTDINTYRSAFNLPAINLQQVLVAGTGDPGVGVSGDLVESDLDLEVSGAIAPNATIIFVYAGFTGGGMGVESATIHAIDNVVAPVISVSYGNCELYSTDTTIGSLPTQDLLYKQAAASGISFFTSSGDEGPATCDINDSSPKVTSAVLGLAVDYPASSWYVTGVGGTEFNEGVGDYWNSGNTGNGGSAKSYIPEKSWNDFSELGFLDGAGGGPSNCFNQDASFTMCLSGNAKPSWQTGAGVPADGVRDVPDVSLSASNFNDPYIVCTPLEALNYPNDAGNTTSSCAGGIASALDQGSAFGGTSASAPLMAGITVLLNQYLNGSSTAGLGNINPMLYSLAASSPTAFHDTPAGSDSIVNCTKGTPTGQPPGFSASVCPSTGANAGTFGFDTTAGYDLVTGLGSVDANKLAVAWAAATRTPTTTLISASSTNINQGVSVTFTATVTPTTATGTVSFYNNGSTPALGTGNLSSGTATFATTALPAGTDSVTATYNGDSGDAVSTSVVPAVVTVTAPFTLSASPLSPSTVSAGQTATSTITVTPVGGFNQAVNFTPSSCTGLPAGALCSFNQGGSVTPPGTIVLSISTAANMALPSGAQTITITGTSGSTSETTTVNLTVTPTTESFTLSTNAATFPVTVGGTASVPITVSSTSTPSFIVGSGAGATTSLPLTYSCSGSPTLSTAEISCQISPGGSNQPTNATAVTITLGTTPPTAQLRPPFGGSRIFYALLLPGLFGVVLVAGSRTRAFRLLSLIVVLGFSTVWLGSCGGGSTNTAATNPGTPKGTYTITVGATTGGANPLTNSGAPFTFTLVVN